MWLNGTLPIEGAEVRSGKTIDQMIVEKYGQDTRSAIAGNLHGRHHGLQWRVRGRHFLRLRQHHQLARRHHSSADGTAIPRWCSSACLAMAAETARKIARRAPKRRAAFWIRSRKAPMTLAVQAGAGRPNSAERLSGERARNRAANAEVRVGDERAGIAGDSGGCSGFVRRACAAAVRSDGAGVSGQHHARDFVHDGAGAEPAHLSVSSAFPTATTPRRTTAKCRTEVEKFVKINTYHVQVFADFMKKMKSIPDGDGSCWITR